MQKIASQGFRLSPQQQHVWWVQRWGEDFSAFVVQARIDITGPLDRQRLVRALEKAVERHEILRTTFPLLPGLSVPVQAVEVSAVIDWSEHSLAGLPVDERETVLGRFSREIRELPFDLAGGPLLRTTLIALEIAQHSERHALLLSQPALAADGSSLDLLATEIAAAYHGGVSAEAGSGDGEVFQYADLAEILHEWQGSPAEDPGPAFWRGQDLSALVRVTLGSAGLPDGQPFRPEHARRRIERAPVATAAERHGTTVSLILLAGWHAMLQISTGEGEIVVGTLFDGRTCAELESALGPFARYLPVCGQSAAGSTLEELSRTLAATMADISRRQDSFSSESVEKLLAEHGASGWPFGFDYRRPRVLPSPPGSPTFAVGDGHLTLDRFAVRLSILDDGESLRTDLTYDPDLFRQGEAEHLLERFSRVLEGLLAGVPLGEIDALTAAERRQMLGFNRTESAIPADLCAHHLFEERVRLAPEALALAYAGRTWTYTALNVRANRLAHHLRASGIGPGMLVGIRLERSPELVEAVLGILKAGAAYVPLDPGYPAERLAWMTEDAGLSLVLTRERLSDLSSQSEKDPPRLAHPADLAYVIYTSGSTGLPKGVMVPHRGLANYLLWARQAYAAGEGAGAPVHSAIGFDLTVTSLLVPLTAGTAVTLLDERRSVEGLVAALRETHGFSLVKLTPAHLDVLRRGLEPGEYAGRARALVIGGETLRSESVAPWREHAPDTRLINEYGPTEATVGCCVYEIAPGDAAAGPVPIGCPIANVRLHVVGPRFQPVPPGAPGELWIGGDGLARGYLSRPALTAERFVPDPFAGEIGREGERLYRTGDLVRMRPDGLLDFLGRIDDQLKIRGFRIEPGEIEAALTGHPKVREAAVVAREGEGGKRLVAYVVPRSRDDRPAAPDLRHHLEARLPDYMVPAAFIGLDSLPLTPNGKLDRRALPDPVLEGGGEVPYAPPRTLTEEVLAEIWAQVLRVDRVGIDDHFFSLGGDSIRSLQILALAQKRGFALTLQDLFQRPTIRALAERVRLPGHDAGTGGEAGPYSLLSEADRRRLPCGIEDAYPLVHLQSGMLFHSEIAPGTAVYHDLHSFRLRGRYDHGLLAAALESTVRRHPVLRTSFDLAGFSEPLQLVWENAAVPLTAEDLRHLTPGHQREAVSAWLEAERHRAFDGSLPPLVRFHVQQLGEDLFQFTLSFHHAVLDGWSAASLLTELFRLYAALLREESLPSLPPLVASFRDLVQLERASLASAETRGFWERHLAGSTFFPLPRWQAPGTVARKVESLEVPLPAPLSEGLRQIARSATLPLKSVLLGAHFRVIGHLAGQDDVVTGLVGHGRPERDDGDQVLGLFLNMLPLRLQLTGGTWAELAQAAFDLERDGIPHRRFPIAEVQRAAGGQQLFESVFNFLHYHVYQGLGQVSGLEMLERTGYEETNFPLVVHFSLDPSGTRIHLQLSHQVAEIGSRQAAAIGRCYLAALEAMAFDSGSRSDASPLLSAAERHQLLTEWNDTAAEIPGESILAWIEGQVARTPGAVAVVSEAESLTYAELDSAANRVANRLVSLGVGPESLVGVAMERSCELVVALLGTLKAGAAYVPLDPGYPKARLDIILKDCGARVLLSQQRLTADLPRVHARVLCLDDSDSGIAAESAARPCLAIGGANAAYVIHTSGSTGTPKGAVNTHRGLLNRLLWMQSAYALTPEDRVLQKTPFSFDVSVWELFWPLMTGARLVVARPDGHRDPAYLAGLIAQEGVTTLHFVPSMLQIFLEEPAAARCSSLRFVFASGEALPFELQQRFYQRFALPTVELHNLYGPTEAAIDVTSWLCRRGSEPRVPIGRPVANTAILILDPRLQPVPLGVPGELCIGGAQVARGYLGRPELTADRFIPDPRTAGGRLYRTGDLARFLPDGSIEYLGRIDFQVKVRGIRIELGEIESALLKHPAIREAVVVAREGAAPKDRRLVAYVVGVGGAGSVSAHTELRRFLQERLPEAMIPSAFVALEELPLTSNGKVDRRALPAPEPRAATKGGYVEPASPAEQALARIWAEVFRVERVGVEDNFFEMGGDSILSLQISMRARHAGFSINPRLVFQHPTVAELAERAQAAGAAKPVPRAVEGPVPLTPIQHWFFAGEKVEPWHFNHAVLLAVTAPLDPGALGPALEKVAVAHPALSLRFRRGPAGWEQQDGGPEATAAPLTIVDIAALPEDVRAAAVTAAASTVQTSLDFEHGPLHRVLLLGPAADGSRRLLWTIHHLAVDGVSWRVLLEDLQTAWRGAGEIPAEGTPFAIWAESLAERARRMAPEEVASEASWWTREDVWPAAALPFDGLEGIDRRGRQGEARRVAVHLDTEETRALLQEVPAAWRTQINDALLTALALTLAPAGGALRVDLEGHGREEGTADADLARTVGWFTALFPVRLEVAPDGDPVATLLATKEHLRAIPGNGLGYGLLRRFRPDDPAMAPLATAAAVEVGFNYLGQLDAALPHESIFAPAPEPAGPTRSPRGVRDHVLEVLAFVAGGRLRIEWEHSVLHPRAVIEALADSFIAHLRELIARGRALVAAGRIGATPSDFPLARIDQAGLDLLLERAPRLEDLYPLSSVQEGMLFHSLYTPAAGIYVDQLLVRLRGPLDREDFHDVFQEGWRRVVAHNPILRTSFHWQGMERHLQAVHAEVPVLVEQEDWSTRSEAEREVLLADLMAADRARGLDLAQAPPLRWRLIRTVEDRYVFLWTHHHILLDGWSISLVLADLVAAVAALRDGNEPVLPRRRPFRDYIAWLGQQDLASAEEYWRRTLAGWSEPTPLGMATPLSGRNGSETRRSWLTAGETAELQAQARHHQVTLNTLVQAAWATLLARTSGHRDVVFGATVSGRPDFAGADTMVGLFINTLPVRVQLGAPAGLPTALRDLQDAQAELRQHEHSPLVQVQGWSGVPHGRALFESILVYESYPRDASLGPGGAALGVTDLRAVEKTNYPLSLMVVPGERLALDLEYDRARFEDTAMLRLMGSVRNLLVGLAARLRDGGAGTLLDLRLLAEEERRQLLVAGTGTPAPQLLERAVHELITAHAVECPGAPAVSSRDRVLSYGELAERAAHLAARLRGRGAVPGTLIGLYLERSPELIIGLLGILGAGAAYVPLDLSSPAERLAFLLADTGVPLIVTRRGLAATLPLQGAETICLDEAEDTGGSPVSAPIVPPEGAPAYIIYTSGSTGRPKGVVVAHRALTNYTRSAALELGFGPADRVLQFASVSFDASAEEIYCTLLAGATLVLLPEGPISPAELLALCREQRITVLDLPTAYWHTLAAELEGGDILPETIRLVIFGGEEALPQALATWRSRVGPGVRLVNAYGPTEGTISVTRWEDTGSALSGRVPIGRPVANVRVHVLDTDLNLLPSGIPGELCLAGAGLARGYLGRPDLTADRFVPDPFASDQGERLYHTGDLVRWREDGGLEFLGRVDRQVKIRGHRIELAEVEAALCRNPSVAQAVVAAWGGPGDRQLAGWIVPAEGATADPAELHTHLRTHLRTLLPEPMVPSAWTVLTALPLTPGGKVDLASLPPPNRPAAAAAAYEEPQTEAEQAIAEIWRDLLGAERVGLHDNFFDLGGHSLLMMRLQNRLLSHFGRDITMVDLFSHTTVSSLARFLTEVTGTAPAPVRSTGQEERIAGGKQRLQRLRQGQPAERKTR